MKPLEMPIEKRAMKANLIDARSKQNMFDYSRKQMYILLLYVTSCLLAKLPWPVDNERNFWSSNQAASCLPVYQTRWRLHIISFYC